MTPKQRERIERMVVPSWQKAGRPRLQGHRFHVYTMEHDLSPLNFPPRGLPGPVSTTYRIARLDLHVFMHEGWQIRKLFAVVEGTDIKVLLSEERS